MILKHILWYHCRALLVIQATLGMAEAILIETSLSYLGFGVRIPQPSWGNMLDEAKEFYRASWTYVFIPGFAIYLAALAFNLVGDGLRDVLDPRTTRR